MTPTRKALLGLASACFALSLLTVASPTIPSVAAPPKPKSAAVTSTERLLPIPAGPQIDVTPENAYNAFPTGIYHPGTAPEGGAIVVAYRKAGGHATADAEVRVRRSLDLGLTWSDHVVVATPQPLGYAYGPAGMTIDSDGPFHRIYLGLVKLKSTGPASGTDYSMHLSVSDDGGQTWTAPLALPSFVTLGSTVASSLLWHPAGGANGTLLASAYGDKTNGKHVGAIAASTDHGATWTRRTPAGTSIALPQGGSTRDLVEPQLTTLANGQILMTIRSDGGETSPGSGLHWESQLWGMVSNDLGVTWSAPWMIAKNASAMPAATVLTTGEVVIVHRGFSEPVNDPLTQPTRVAVLDQTGHPVGDLRAQSHDVLADDLEGYSLYGKAIALPDGRALLVWSAEGPADHTTAVGGAQVNAMLLDFKPRGATS